MYRWDGGVVLLVGGVRKPIRGYSLLNESLEQMMVMFDSFMRLGTGDTQLMNLRSIVFSSQQLLLPSFWG